MLGRPRWPSTDICAVCEVRLVFGECELSRFTAIGSSQPCCSRLQRRGSYELFETAPGSSTSHAAGVADGWWRRGLEHVPSLKIGHTAHVRAAILGRCRRRSPIADAICDSGAGHHSGRAAGPPARRTLPMRLLCAPGMRLVCLRIRRGSSASPPASGSRDGLCPSNTDEPIGRLTRRWRRIVLEVRF